MNRYYRSLFNVALGAWVAVSELAKSYRKSSNVEESSAPCPPSVWRVPVLSKPLVAALGLCCFYWAPLASFFLISPAEAQAIYGNGNYGDNVNITGASKGGYQGAVLYKNADNRVPAPAQPRLPRRRIAH